MTRSQALYLKWRPTTFDQVVGQEHVVQTIANSVVSDRNVHAYLFCGPRGTGKTTLARLLAKALNCSNIDRSQRPCCSCNHCIAIQNGRFLDLLEIDAASNNSVEDIRDLRDKINFSPGQGQFKVYIVDEVHMLSGAAFNALLKTVEEPPPHAIFILATTEVNKVPQTVTSRCQVHHFRRIALTQIVERLGVIADAEGISFDPEVLGIIGRQATGSLRDAISLLDQLVTSPDVSVTADHARKMLGIVGHQAVEKLVNAMVACRSDQGLDLINTSYDEGADPSQFAQQIVDYLRGVLLCKLGNSTLVEASEPVKGAMENHAQNFEISLLLRALQLFDHAARDKRGGWMAQLPIELAYLRCLQPETVVAQAESRTKLQKADTETTYRSDVVRHSVEAGPQEKLQEERSDAEGSETLPIHTDGGVEIKDFVKRWQELVECSKIEHHAMPALLEWCHPIKIDDDTLLLGVRQEFALSRLDDRVMRASLEKVLVDMTGHALSVKFVRSESQSDFGGIEVDEDGVVALGVELGARPRER